MKRSIVRLLATGGIIGSLLFATPALAAGLNEIQIQAILTLLQSFGVSDVLVNNVRAALMKTITVPAAPANGLSPWGEKLVKNTWDIPTEKFRAYWIKYDTFAEQGPSEVVDRIYWDYGSGTASGGTFGSNKLGAYWVGNFDIKTNQIAFDLSNPQWDVARAYVDGVLVVNYGNNMGSYYGSYPVTPGRHTISVEYESHWHAGTFTAQVGATVGKYSTDSQLKSFVSSLGVSRTLAVFMYGTSDRKSGLVTVQLPTYSGKTLVVLSSYSPIIWDVQGLEQANVRGVVLLSLEGGSSLAKPGTLPTAQARGGSGYVEDASKISGKIGREVDSFISSATSNYVSIPAPGI